jgi:hypothetical protein
MVEHDLFPGCAWTPDRLVELAKYKARCHIEAAQHTVATGERVSAGAVRARICRELELSDDDLLRLAYAGDQIAWDRELREMTAEERAEALGEIEEMAGVDLRAVPEWREAIERGEQERAEVAALEALLSAEEGEAPGAPLDDEA